VFSGGKALRGPSGSGILCGRRDLVASALLQNLDLDFEYDQWQPPAQLVDKSELGCVPRNGIGRSCKAGKEQIVGLLLALSRFAATDDATRHRAWMMLAEELLTALVELPELHARVVLDPDGRGVPLVEVNIGAGAGATAAEVAATLRAGTPSIRVDASRAQAGVIVLVPTCLGRGDVPHIGRAFARALMP
jgi:L-seryl-tRNA(Ser) seleniumtransferase